MKKPPIPFPLIEKMEDRPLVWCLLKKMELETGQFFYGMYWPLFCKLFRFYYTDCDNEIEVADEIHLHIMTPPKNSTQTRLELFNFQCRLARWMKVVSVHYYYTKGKRHRKLTFFESAEDIPASNDGGISATVGLDREDFEKILELMRNERYRTLMRLHYIEGLDHNDTAKEMGEKMSDYYRTHERARRQFKEVYQRKMT